MTRFCKKCRSTFEATPYRIEAGDGVYCGKVCKKAALAEQPHPTRAQAFENRPTSWWADGQTWDEFSAASRSHLPRMQSQANLTKVARMPE